MIPEIKKIKIDLSILESNIENFYKEANTLKSLYEKILKEKNELLNENIKLKQELENLKEILKENDENKK